MHIYTALLPQPSLSQGTLPLSVKRRFGFMTRLRMHENARETARKLTWQLKLLYFVRCTLLPHSDGVGRGP